MPAPVNKEIQLEIAHVLFIDIVGYSKLLINEQHELLQKLNQIVRGTGGSADGLAGRIEQDHDWRPAGNLRARSARCSSAGHVHM